MTALIIFDIYVVIGAFVAVKFCKFLDKIGEDKYYNFMIADMRYPREAADYLADTYYRHRYKTLIIFNVAWPLFIAILGVLVIQSKLR